MTSPWHLPGGCTVTEGSLRQKRPGRGASSLEVFLKNTVDEQVSSGSSSRMEAGPVTVSAAPPRSTCADGAWRSPDLGWGASWGGVQREQRGRRRGILNGSLTEGTWFFAPGIHPDLVGPEVYAVWGSLRRKRTETKLGTERWKSPVKPQGPLASL